MRHERHRLVFRHKEIFFSHRMEWPLKNKKPIPDVNKSGSDTGH
jgi:hypothetical protein